VFFWLLLFSGLYSCHSYGLLAQWSDSEVGSLVRFMILRNYLSDALVFGSIGNVNGYLQPGWKAVDAKVGLSCCVYFVLIFFLFFVLTNVFFSSVRSCFLDLVPMSPVRRLLHRAMQPIANRWTLIANVPMMTL
jgi:hypothetical protein